MTQQPTNRRLVRITTAAATTALLFTGCTQPTGEDPAAQAAIAYYTSVDNRTPDNCDLTWGYRTDPAALANCKSNPIGGYGSITSIEVPRVVAMPGPTGGTGKALTVTMGLKEGSAVYAVAMAQDEAGKWFWVKDESLPKAPASDSELIAALS